MGVSAVLLCGCVFGHSSSQSTEKKELLLKVHSRIFYVRHLFGAFRNSVFFLKLVVVVNFFKVHVKEKVHTLSFRSF